MLDLGIFFCFHFILVFKVLGLLGFRCDADWDVLEVDVWVVIWLGGYRVSELAKGVGIRVFSSGWGILGLG